MGGVWSYHINEAILPWNECFVTKPCWPGTMECRLQKVHCMLRQNARPITESFPNTSLPVHRRAVPQQALWAVDLELSIKAEIRRLFHALTAPEYIETWISFPGHPAGCANVATKVENDFLIAHICEEGPATRISGRFSVCERRNLAFSWRVEGDRNTGTSFVNIRLSGDFEYTTLQLKHGGFASREQYGWHRSLWSTSLAKLKRLYDSSPLSYA
jgi:uncharacterized protein YndB with AHSA1/START domain